MKNLKDTIHAYIFIFAVDDPISLTIVKDSLKLDNRRIQPSENQREIASQTCGG